MPVHHAALVCGRAWTTPGPDPPGPRGPAQRRSFRAGEPGERPAAASRCAGSQVRRNSSPADRKAAMTCPGNPAAGESRSTASGAHVGPSWQAARRARYVFPTPSMPSRLAHAGHARVGLPAGGTAELTSLGDRHARTTRPVCGRICEPCSTQDPDGRDRPAARCFQANASPWSDDQRPSRRWTRMCARCRSRRWPLRIWICSGGACRRRRPLRWMRASGLAASYVWLDAWRIAGRT